MGLEFQFSPDSAPRRSVVPIGSLVQKHVARGPTLQPKIYRSPTKQTPQRQKSFASFAPYPKPLPHIRRRRTAEKLRRLTGQHAQVLSFILKTETIAVLRPDGPAGGFLFAVPPALRLGTLQTNGRRAKRGQFQ
jgi:hypothetical protein